MKKLIFIFLLPLAALAESVDTKNQMHLLLTDLKVLENFIFSETAFESSENAPAIKDSLERMADHLKGMKLEHFKNDPAARSNVEMLSRHIEETQQYYKENNKKFARFMVKNALQMCINCHTRMPKGNELFINDSLEKRTDINPIEYAEYLFASRQYSRALEKFQQIVDQSLDKDQKKFADTLNLKKSLMNIAIIYARVKQEPKVAASYFNKIANKKETPLYLKEDVKAWANSFEKWAKGKKEKNASDAKTLLSQAKEILAKDNLTLASGSSRKFHIDRLRASALLHNVLDLPEMLQEKGEALYLLGLIYNKIDHSLFFHFDETYLKSCIYEFKNSKIAQNCYDALERIIYDGYTGSSGMDLPEAEELELIKLKKMAY